MSRTLESKETTEQRERLAFYAGAKPSETQQARLDAMKDWSATRLAAAVPAWAKPNLPPAPFKPQLTMRFPSWTYRRTLSDLRTVADFALPLSSATAYIAAWNRRMGYKAAKRMGHKAVAT